MSNTISLEAAAYAKGKADAFAEVMRQGMAIYRSEANDIQDRRAIRAFIDRFAHLTSPVSVGEVLKDGQDEAKR